MRTLSLRGKPVDFAQLIAKNEKMVAIGNASMNARGDIIGANGQIVKAKEDTAREYHNSNPRAVKVGGLNSITNEILMTPAEAVKKAKEDAQALAPAPAPKRKLSDTE